MDTMIDQSDYRLELARHIPSGAAYLLQYNSTWNEAGDCVGWTYTACVGPLDDREWQSPAESGQARGDWLDWGHDLLADAGPVHARGDAQWANAQHWETVVVQP